MGISQKTRKLLWVRSGNECAFVGCSQKLTLSEEEGQNIVVGEEAHIVARTPDGPRGKEVPPGREVNGISNLILFCPTHHRIVDEQPHIYTVSALRVLKRNHERNVRDGQGVQSYGAQVIVNRYSESDSGLPLFGVWQFGDAALIVTTFGSEPSQINDHTWKGAGLVFRVSKGNSVVNLGEYSEADNDVIFSVVGPKVVIIEQIFDYGSLIEVPFIQRTCDLSENGLTISSTILMEKPDQPMYSAEAVERLYKTWLEQKVDPELAVLNLREIGFTNPDSVITALDTLRRNGYLDGAVAECANSVKQEITAYISVNDEA